MSINRAWAAERPLLYAPKDTGFGS